MGRFDAAYAGFREARRRDPRNPDALYYLALTAGALAEAEYARLVELAPGSARAHQLRGQSLRGAGPERRRGGRARGGPRRRPRRRRTSWSRSATCGGRR